MWKPAALSLFAVTIFAFSIVDAAEEKPGEPPKPALEVRFTDGSTMQIAGYEIRQNFVWLKMPNGARLVFDENDIDMSSLHTESAAQPSESAKDEAEDYKNLQDAAKDIHIGVEHIEVNRVYSGSIWSRRPKRSEIPDFEEQRKQTIAQFKAAIEPLAQRAREATRNIQAYEGGCTGTTTTYHHGETRGAGVESGQGTVYPSNGGFVDYTYDSIQLWSQEYYGTSTTYNAENPYCMGLAEQIQSDVNALWPAMNSAVSTAFLSGTVTPSDLDAILSAHGVFPSKAWVRY